jgi:hypothetical protein
MEKWGQPDPAKEQVRMNSEFTFDPLASVDQEVHEPLSEIEVSPTETRTSDRKYVNA